MKTTTANILDKLIHTESEQLNKLNQIVADSIREEELIVQNLSNPISEVLKRGDKIEVIAALEINKEHIRFDDLELIPVRLKILQ